MSIRSSWSFMDLTVWLFGLKIRTNLGEKEKRSKDKEKKKKKTKNWRNVMMMRSPGEEN